MHASSDTNRAFSTGNCLFILAFYPLGLGHLAHMVMSYACATGLLVLPLTPAMLWGAVLTSGALAGLAVALTRHLVLVAMHVAPPYRWEWLLGTLLGLLCAVSFVLWPLNAHSASLTFLRPIALLFLVALCDIYRFEHRRFYRVCR